MLIIELTCIVFDVFMTQVSTESKRRILEKGYAIPGILELSGLFCLFDVDCSRTTVLDFVL